MGYVFDWRYRMQMIEFGIRLRTCGKDLRAHIMTRLACTFETKEGGRMTQYSTTHEKAAG